MVATIFDDIRLCASAPPPDPGNQEGDHCGVHDRAHGEEDDEQRIELLRFRSGIAVDALVMLIAAGAGKKGERQDCCARAHDHCPAVSDECAGSRGASVAGVVVLIPSARLPTASLLGCPDMVRT